MIDLDKWAAVSTDDLRRAAELVRFAYAPKNGQGHHEALAARLLAARPTDAPVLIDPARLRELEADAARYQWLRHGDNDELVMRVTDTGQSRSRPYNESTDTFYLLRNESLDEAIDKSLQEPPR